MNGAVYISFFQGQLESVLEQVVQLAVQEISKSVGSSLNALLLETAVKEQENRRLRLQLQARDGAGGAPLLPGNKAGEGVEPSGASATRRLEQRGRVVDQLKCVMEQVLDFAVRELTKIVEASFDDLLLEITKMESEQLLLEQRLGGGGAERGGRRRGSENNAEEAELSTAKDRVWTGVSSEPPCPPVLSVSQDWVPILDKVFGQRWCRDVWQIKELSAKGKGDGPEPLSASPIALEPSPSSPQQDPRWTPLEDMEVLSPDNDHGQAPAPSTNPGPGPPDRPEPQTGPGPPLSPKRRRSSASMLHRLLTLPSQLMEDDEDAAKQAVVVVTTDGSEDCRSDTEPLDHSFGEGEGGQEDEEDDGEDEEDKGRKRKRRRVWTECEECGRRFSRASLLKAHRQSHASSRNEATPILHCSDCGKRFSSATRLHSHTHTQHPAAAPP